MTGSHVATIRPPLALPAYFAVAAVACAVPFAVFQHYAGMPLWWAVSIFFGLIMGTTLTISESRQRRSRAHADRIHYRSALRGGEIVGDWRRWPGWIERDRKANHFFGFAATLIVALDVLQVALGGSWEWYLLLTIALMGVVVFFRVRSQLKALRARLSPFA